jgi:hypothetical protein
MNLIFHDLLGVIVEVHIDDMMVKSDGFPEHMANLHVSLERMRRYGVTSPGLIGLIAYLYH